MLLTRSVGLSITASALGAACALAPGAFASSSRPHIVHSTFLGGNKGDTQGPHTFAEDVAADGAGHIYVTGDTATTDYPVKRAFQSRNHGQRDAVLTKLSPDGHSIVFSTYLGGKAGDYGLAVAATESGRSFLAGSTFSGESFHPSGAKNCPPQSDPSQGSTFVAAFEPHGALVYLVCMDGSYLSDIAAAPDGSAYIAGSTSDPSAFPSAHRYGEPDGSDAFVAELDPGGNLQWSAVLGGNGADGASGVAVDDNGNVYLNGNSQNGVPTTDIDGPGSFAAKLTPDGSQLVYATKWHSFPSEASGIAVTSGGRTIVTGTIGHFNNDRADGVVEELGRKGTRTYARRVGGSKHDECCKVVQINGVAIVTGSTESDDLPRKHALQKHLHGDRDAFFMRISKRGRIRTSSYLGGNNDEYGEGIALSGPSVVLVGDTKSERFPTTKDAYEPSFEGNKDIFVTELTGL